MIPGSDAEDVAHYKPHYKKDAYHNGERCGIDFPVQSRTFHSLGLNPHQKCYERQRHSSERVGPECSCEIAVKKSMRHALTAAPHTLPACDPMEYALGHESAREWVKQEIE
uniref:Uncharacterized protein n=1 Tax=uncultured Muribaculaceae bacterium TaxID=2301481 RepID=A0A6G8F3R5_9BACT|nr:hypothetical protein Muribac1_0820 [uncultured Muribaculaceae bacterium]